MLASVSWFRGVEVMKSSQVVRGRRVGPGLGPLPGPRPLVMGERLAKEGQLMMGNRVTEHSVARALLKTEHIFLSSAWPTS